MLFGLVGGSVVRLLSWVVIALPMLGLLIVPFLWRSLPTEGSGAHLDLLGAVLVAGTAAGVVLLVQSPSTGPVIAAAGVALVVLGVPAVPWWVRRRPHGFRPLSVIRNPVVVRSALDAAAVPAAWFALLVAVPAVLVAEGWEPWVVGVALVPSAVTGLLAPRIAGPLLARVGAAASLAVAGLIAAVALAVAAAGAALGSAALLVSAVVAVTLAFGLGQPALMQAVGGAVEEDVRGVALGVATLFSLVGGGVGSAVVGGTERRAHDVRRAAAARGPADGRTGRSGAQSASRPRRLADQTSPSGNCSGKRCAATPRAMNSGAGLPTTPPALPSATMVAPRCGRCSIIDP